MRHPARIWGKAADGTWHIASGTVFSEMRTRCGKKMKAAAYVASGDDVAEVRP